MSGHSETQGYEARVRASFAKQGFMGTLGATMGNVAPELVEIVFSESGGQEKLIALLTATLMAMEGREGVSD